VAGDRAHDDVVGGDPAAALVVVDVHADAAAAVADESVADVIPEGARIPGYVMQYGVGIPLGVVVSAVVWVPLALAVSFVLPGHIVDPLFLGICGVTSVWTTRGIVRRLRAFQERKLLQASDVDHRPRQLRGAGGTESPVAVRE
jgi:hypothetical protein